MMPSANAPMAPANAAHMHQQQIAAQAAQAHAAEMAKRRSRKPTDKTMPEGIEAIVIGDGAEKYKELRDFERRLDATMTRKRLDVIDSVNRHSKRFKTLRIWVSNTVEDQLWQGNGLDADSFDFTSNLESTYRVKIEGRLLETDDDGDGAEEKEKDKDGAADANKMDTDSPVKNKAKGPTPVGEKSRFSHFFKALTVEFDRGKLRNSTEQAVEWKKPERAPNQANLPAAADFDELTFRRSGDENANITINLYRHEEPERFELSPELAEVVDMKEATREEAVMALWEYIKLMGLQEDEEKRNFRCDELLKKVIRKDSGYIPHLQEHVVPHLKPLPPIKLVYTIRVDEEFHKDPQPTVYDVRVAVDDPLRAKLISFPFLQNTQYAGMLKEVAALDDQLALLVQAVGESKAKHSFLDGLSRNPSTFLNHWISSQNRDLEVITGSAVRGGGEDALGHEWRQGGDNSVWASQHARESVRSLLAKQPAPR